MAVSTGITNITNTAAAGADNSARIKDINTRRENQLKTVCRQFEAIFIEQFMREMRSSIPKSKLTDGGPAEEIFQSMKDEKTAQELSLRGMFGIGDILFREMKNSVLITDPRALDKYEKQTKILDGKVSGLERK